MKKYISLLITSLAVMFFVDSCQKAPFLIMTGPRMFTFTRDGGTQSFSFSVNRDWSVTSTESWIEVTPASGTATDGEITVTITCSPNTTYDVRSASITVKTEAFSESITVTQETGIGLFVLPTIFDLTNAAQDIEIEVQKNVEYSITIDEASVDWIKADGTKALSTDKIAFHIAENTSYDNREGKITFKQMDGNLSEIVIVRQSQMNGLFITTPEYDLSNEAHTLTVEVKANVEFDVSPQAEWIKYISTTTKALSPSQITLQIDANGTYDNREGKVVVKQTNGDLVGTIVIRQDENYGILVSQEAISISKEEQKVEVEVKYNVDFEIVIPSEVQGTMISNVEYSDDNGETKSLSTCTYRFTVTENKTYDARKASITFKQKDGTLSGTFVIFQEETKTVIVSKNHFDIKAEGGTFDVNLKYNVPYTVDIKDIDWIEEISTKALSEQSITFSVANNQHGEERQGIILISAEAIDLVEEITVFQYGAGVYNGNVIISSEAELIEWGNNDYEYIDGDVKINAINGIISLSSLNDKWKEITGELYIEGSNLISLKGLGSLKSLGNLTIHNYSGESLKGLSSLQNVNGFVNFEGVCRPLKNMAGLEKLERIGGSLKFTGGWADFHEFQSFEGLNNLKSIGGDLSLKSDFCNLRSFEGLNSLESIGGSLKLDKASPTYYSSFDQIVDFNGLNSLKRIGEDFLISGSFDNLKNFAGLEKLEYVGNTFNVGWGYNGDYSSYNSLESFEGLYSLKQIGYLCIDCNDPNIVTTRSFKKLKSLRGLENVNYLGAFATSPHNIESIDALSNVSNSEMRVLIISAPITKIGCFQNVEKITESLTISDCNFLKNLNDLSRLKYLSRVDIHNCNRLNSIEVFSHVNHVNSLSITQNQSLYDFSPLYDLLANNSVGMLTITGNGYNPTKEQILNGHGKPE